LQLLAQLSRWLESHGLGEHDLSEERVAQFLEARRAEGYSRTPPLSWALELLSLVPGLEIAVAVPGPLTPIEAMVGHFGHYLLAERGLATETIRGYLGIARLFLSRWGRPDGDLDLSQVSARAVTAFVISERRRLQQEPACGYQTASRTV
jgi:integrase/recombinase XerD